MVLYMSSIGLNVYPILSLTGSHSLVDRRLPKPAIPQVAEATRQATAKYAEPMPPFRPKSALPQPALRDTAPLPGGIQRPETTSNCTAVKVLPRHRPNCHPYRHLQERGLCGAGNVMGCCSAFWVQMGTACCYSATEYLLQISAF